MIICHITTVHKLNDVRIYLKECKSLAKSHDVILIGNDNTNDIFDDNINIINLKVHFKNRIHRILSTKKLIVNTALKINADVYHFHDPELMGAALTIKKSGKKVIYDFHEDTPKQILAKHYIPKPIRKPISMYYKRFEEKSASKFDGIVTATPYLKSKFIKFNKNTEDVNNYPILDEFVNLSNDLDNKQNDLIYIGGISRERGLYEMVEIANKLPDIKIVVCGPFISKADEINVKPMIKNNNIEFKGMLDRSGIQEELQNAKIGLVLLEKNERYSESLPIKMFEYMAAGLPVIATDFTLWKNIINESNAGICLNPKDIDSIISNVNDLLENQSLLKQKGDSGRQFVLDKYNWENEEVKLLNLYKKLEEN